MVYTLSHSASQAASQVTTVRRLLLLTSTENAQVSK